MSRAIKSIETEFEGVIYRSRTEARWAVFFTELGVTFDYEAKLLQLESGVRYLPDFYIHDFNAYFEVKPSNENVVTKECIKARELARTNTESAVWLSIGSPSADEANILPLNLWSEENSIQEILESPENRYKILEDRRDHQVYWIQADFVDGGFKHSYMIGGPGVSTDHERLPELHRSVLKAYETADNIKF